MPTVLLLVDVRRNMLEPPEPVPQAETAGAAMVPARATSQAVEAELGAAAVSVVDPAAVGF